jgi:CTP:molybdopterin cytidylyltransferase MocA
LAPESTKKHIGVAKHLKMVNSLRESKQQQALLAAAHAQEHLEGRNETADVNTHNWRQQRQPLSRTATAGESNMWAQYELNGSLFDFDDDPTVNHPTIQDLDDKFKDFGLWDADAAAKQLYDADEGQDVADEDEEDKLLAEIMSNIGECVV